MADDYLREFVHESEEQITTLNNALLDLERDPADEDAMEQIFRTAHTLKSNCGAMGFTRASDLAHAVEDLLEEVRAGRVDPTPELMDAVFAGVDALEAMLEDVESHGEPQQDATTVVEDLRSHVPSGEGIAPPTNSEIESILEAAAPDRTGYNLYHARLAIAGDQNANGPAVIDALDDAFELFRTEPSAEVAAGEQYGSTIDALFGSVVSEDAVHDALDPVDAVDDAIITEVTDRYSPPSPSTAEDSTEEATAEDDPAVEDPGDADIDALLDSVDHFDDIDEMAEEIEDTSGLENMGEAGTFDDLDLDIDDELGIDDGSEADEGSESPADASAKAEADDESEEEPEDANETFQELKQEVDPVSFDELQDELQDLEFDEYADEEEVGFDELLEEDELEGDDGPFGGDPFEDEADDPFGSEADDESVDELLEETIEDDEPPEASFGDDPEEAVLGTDDTEPATDDDATFASGDEDGIFDDLDEELGDTDEMEIDDPEPADGTEAADIEDDVVDTEAETADTEAETADTEAVDADAEAVEADTEVAEDAAASAETVEANVESVDADAELDTEDDEEGDDSSIPTGDVPSVDDESGFGDVDEPEEALETAADTSVEFGDDDTSFEESTAKTFEETDRDEGESVEVASGIEDDSFGDDSFDEIDASAADATPDSVDDDLGESIGDFGDDTVPEGGTTPEEAVETSTFAAEETVETETGGVPEDSGFSDTGDGEFGAPEDPGFGEAPDDDDEEEEREIDLADLGVPRSILTEANEGDGEVQSIRVDVDRMDDMLNLIEGLVTSRARLRRALNEGEPRSVLDDELGDLEDVTSALQDTVMDVRLVPLNTIVSKLPRTVRDIAREHGKQVDLEMVGTDVEIDRSVLNEINDPLVHLIRNAVDHGIEMPEEREASEKPETGTIELRAERARDRVIIEVEDDGRGLDPDTIRSEAIEEGVVTEAEAEEMPDEEVFELVFHSGLSTSEEVTDISGRGVGMDVVANTVEDLDGDVHIESTLGEGTTVRLELPVTLAIAEVLFVQVGDEEYGIPIKYVEQIGPEMGVETQDGQEVLVSDGGETDGESAVSDADADDDDAEDEPRRLIRLDEAFDTPGESSPNGMLVHIRDDVRPIALRVDSVRGQQEVVIKPFEGVLDEIPGLSGATVLGDGDVVNILDVETI